MKILYLVLLLCLSCFPIYAQTPEKIEKAAPFTAVDWEGDSPKVQVNDKWYYFEQIDGIGKQQLVSFCRDKYGSRWQKRFSEDLVEVLTAMGHTPAATVALTLTSEGKTNILTVPMTRDNRTKVKAYNDAHNRTKPAEKEAVKNITKEQALTDINYLQQKIAAHYAYATLKNIDYVKSFEQLKHKLDNDVPVADFAIDIQKVLALFGDGHSRVAGISKILPAGYLPFAIAYHKDGVLCIDNTAAKLYDEEYPFLQSVNGVHVDSLLYIAAQIVAVGSKQFVQQHATERLAYIRYLLKEARSLKGEELSIVLRNKKGKTKNIVSHISSRRYLPAPLKGEHALLANNKIGYLRIPEMTSNLAAISTLKDKMESFKTTGGLIIDIRDNPGGSRNILQTLAPYFIPADAQPLAVNAAVFRTDSAAINPEGYLADRYLYPITSKQLDAADKSAIEKFKQTFQPEWKFPKEQFSDWHYMLVKPGGAGYYYNKPVIVLVNANCFSAADVFTAAFKELPNVKIMGEATGGGSGRAQKYTLPASGIEVQLSTMASFQINGKLFDFNGVMPDMQQEESIYDILRQTDSQLNAAVKRLINN